MVYRLLESLFNCQLRFLAVYQVVRLGSSFSTLRRKQLKIVMALGGVENALSMDVPNFANMIPKIIRIPISRILEYSFLLWMCPKVSLKF